MSAPMPALFVSHGSPTLILETDAPAHVFLSQLAAQLPRPRAVLVISAHWETAIPTVSAAAAPETIHDFYGFPAELYRRRYPAPGAPETAARVVELLEKAGSPVAAHPSRGLDHGAWAPLSLIWPAADVPALQLSVQPQADAAAHLALGRALRPLLDEGVLVLGSGSATHNLRALDWRGGDGPPADWSTGFADWLTDRVTAGDAAAAADWLKQAPYARMAHPTDDHFMPLPVAWGAAGEGARGSLLHDSYMMGSLGMQAYRFDPISAA